MKINLIDNWYLTSDEHQYKISELLKKKNNKTGEMEEYFGNQTFHTTRESALWSFLDRRIRRAPITTIKGLIKKEQENKKLVKKWLKDAGVT